MLCRALLEGESIEAANRYIEARRDTELHKVIKDQWLNKAFQDTVVGTQHPEPPGYAATALMCSWKLAQRYASTALCQHKQADGKGFWCDQCLHRAPASWWPPA